MGNTHQIVEVVWRDAVASEQWHHIHEIPTRPVKVRSVGYLHKQTKHAVVLLSSVSDDRGASWIVIPAGMVEKIRKVDGN